VIAVFTGTRKSLDIASVVVRKELSYLAGEHGNSLSVLVGDCPSGLDNYVRIHCKRFGIDCAIFQANWDALGRRAGPHRNSFMIDLAELLSQYSKVVVFYYTADGVESKGTADCVRKARAAGLECVAIGDGVEL